MDNNFTSFMFKNRKFFSISAFAIPIVLKIFLHGRTSMLLLIVGLIIVIMGMALRIYSAGYLWGRHIVTKLEADILCTSGPYAYLRSPLYLGNFIVGVGICISLNEWYGYTLFLINFICMYSIIIPYEERFLQEKFGDVYIKYKANTRRLLPKLKGYKSSMKLNTNYKLAIWSEKFYLIILVMIFIIFYLLFVM